MVENEMIEDEEQAKDKKYPYTLYITKPLRADLKEYAKKTGRTYSESVSRLLAYALENIEGDK